MPDQTEAPSVSKIQKIVLKKGVLRKEFIMSLNASKKVFDTFQNKNGANQDQHFQQQMKKNQIYSEQMVRSMTVISPIKTEEIKLNDQLPPKVIQYKANERPISLRQRPYTAVQAILSSAAGSGETNQNMSLQPVDNSALEELNTENIIPGTPSPKKFKKQSCASQQRMKRDLLLDNYKQHLKKKSEKHQKYALMRALRQPNKAKVSTFLTSIIKTKPIPHITPLADAFLTQANSAAPLVTTPTQSSDQLQTRIKRFHSQTSLQQQSLPQSQSCKKLQEWRSESKSKNVIVPVKVTRDKQINIEELKKSVGMSNRPLLRQEMSSKILRRSNVRL